MSHNSRECAGCGRVFDRNDYIIENMIAGDKYYTCDDSECIEAVIRCVYGDTLKGADIYKIITDVWVSDGRAYDLLEFDSDDESLSDLEDWAWENCR